MLLSDVEGGGRIPRLKWSFPGKRRHPSYMGYLCLRVRDLLKGEDFYALEMVFHFVAAFVDHFTGFVQLVSMDPEHMRYTKTVSSLKNSWGEKNAALIVLPRVKRDMQRLSEMMENIFDDHCER